MFRTPWYVVMIPDKKHRLKVVYESNLEPEAERYQEQHGGMVVKTSKLVDDYAPLNPQVNKDPEFTGPIHQHVGPVPPMKAAPAQTYGLSPIIQVGDRYVTAQFEQDGDVYEIVDERTEPRSTMLEFSPQMFADIMEALKNAEPEDEGDGGSLVPR